MAKAFDLAQWARPEMLALAPYTSARDTFTATEGTYTFLDANENPNASAVNRYPDPSQLALKKEIAASRDGDVVDENLGLIDLPSVTNGLELVRSFVREHKIDAMM